jgi:hypothetical protein
LPYRIELVKSGERLVERVLGRAANAQLANAIFKGHSPSTPTGTLHCAAAHASSPKAATKALFQAEPQYAWDR